jgi:hypothetical protein
MTDLSTAPPARLFTTWGTVLYVDAASGELRHGPIDTSPANAVLVAAPRLTASPRRGGFMHLAGEKLEPIACGTLGYRSIPGANTRDPPVEPTLLDLLPLERGLVALKAGSAFLCAEPLGGISLSRPVCSHWECFLASEDWCAAPLQTGEPPTPDIASPGFDRKNITSYVVSPFLRTKIGAGSHAVQLLFFGYTHRSHGRVYYDLCKRLHQRGYVADIMDWRADHTAYIADLTRFYDLFITSFDGVQALVDDYGVPYERIIALSHGEFDMQIFIDEKGTEAFARFAAYGVVSHTLLFCSLTLGVTRIPAVVPIGIDFAAFYAELPERLSTVGYASTLSVISKYGVELKREDLARECAKAAGLDYRRSASPESYVPFPDMPEFYKRVDAVLISSLQEGAGLPAMEAAAAGRLVISTLVGHFPLKAAQGGGIIAPINAGRFKTFTAKTLQYYKDNPIAYVDKCRSIQQAARQFDWNYAIDEWIEFIESARGKRGPTVAANDEACA